MAKIEFKIDNETLFPDEEYEKQYSKGIMDAKKKRKLDEEILKSKDTIELDEYNLLDNIIKEIDSQVESLYAASFESFFFGYLDVLKTTIMKFKAEFTKENLSDFQKCYIQKFLMRHRNNKNAKSAKSSIKKQFLLDMYFFFNKNSGKPQNIFGKEVVDYFNDCITKWFVDDKKSWFGIKSTAINWKFGKKLEPFKNSALYEIQIIEMDQKEN